MRDRTTIVISHDLLTVRDADQILVLEGGRVAERGSHAELVAAGGRYASLWALHDAAEPAAA
jgi:ATP-binding cassette subfamily B protein